MLARANGSVAVSFVCNFVRSKRYYMYAQESILDILFMMLYGATAMLTLAVALYLLLRRTNAIAPAVIPPRVVRRWAAAFLLTATASHVWWYMFGTYWLTDDRPARNIALIMLDHITLVPPATAMLLSMLQDRRRKLWPWLVAELPIVALGIAGIVMQDYKAMHWMNGWQSAVIIAFIVYYFQSLRRYNRWLQHNFADLEHKDIWKSMVFAAVLSVIYEAYCTNPGLMPLEYLSQFFTIFISIFIVWRVETLQELTVEATTSVTVQPEADNATPAESTAMSPIDFAPLLRERCEATGLYLQHDLTLAQLAHTLGTNRTYLSAYFARIGTTYNAYINQLRIARFERQFVEAMERTGKAGVTAKDLATECGFSSYSTFSAVFKKYRGVTVAEWMRRQK